MTTTQHTYKGGQHPQLGDIVTFVFGGDQLTGTVGGIGDWHHPSGQHVQLAVTTTVLMPAGAAQLLQPTPAHPPDTQPTGSPENPPGHGPKTKPPRK
jgi:hypothetical protein